MLVVALPRDAPGAFRTPGIMWAPAKIPTGVVLDQMMPHMDVWPTTAAMVGLTPPPVRTENLNPDIIVMKSAKDRV